jgi:drug/metabolite transporter (DMT)-like permease
VPLGCLLALGAFGTAIANVLMSSAAGKFGAALCIGHHVPDPCAGACPGVVVLHERVALLSVAGGLVCVAGAWLMKRAAAHRN